MFKVSSFRSAGNIIFGNGAIENIGAEAVKLKATKALVLTDSGVMKTGIASRVKELLEKEQVEAKIFDRVEPEPSIESFEECLAISKDNFNLIVGVGGGSSIDMSKLISIMATNPGKVQDYFGENLVGKRGLPKIAVPTTAGTGSEVTQIGILTDKQKELKIGVVSPFNLPDVAIVDPVLTINMPQSVTAATGMDALAHAIEAYTSLNSDLLTDILAEKAIELISQNLRTAVSNGADVGARHAQSCGSLMAGLAFANAGVTAVHALAFPVGGMFHVPHGVANAILLPYVMEFNYIARLGKFARVARLMGEKVEGLSLRESAQKTITALRQLSQDIGIPQRLREVGVSEDAITQLTEGASTVTRLLVKNPRRIGNEDIFQIFKKAI